MKGFLQKLNGLGGTKLFPGNHDNREYSIESNVKWLQEHFVNGVPEEYLAFISTIGAFAFNNEVAVKAQDAPPIVGENGYLPVDYFFDFSDDNSSIIQNLKNLTGNIPSHFLPICESTPGDYIGISLKKEDCGKIYFWNHEEDFPNSLYLVSDDFTDFIAALNKAVNEESKNDNGAREAKAGTPKVTDEFLEMLRKDGFNA